MPSRSHQTKYQETTYNYMLFDSVHDFHAFTNRESKFLSFENASVWKEVQASTRERILYGSDWYGTPPVQGIWQLEEHYSFLGMDLVKVIAPRVKEHLA